MQVGLTAPSSARRILNVATHKSQLSASSCKRLFAHSTAQRHAPSVQAMDETVEQLIGSIHGTKTQAVLYTTGGAVQAMSWLLSVPGASATVLEASVPYARDSLVSVLGHEPEQYCSEGTAVAMAKAAYQRAAQLCGFGASIVGVGATCALATVPMKRGAHRAHLALHSGTSTHSITLTLLKGARSRVMEDELASRLVIKMLAEASGCDASSLPLPLVHHAPDAGPVDLLEEDTHDEGDPLELLVAGKVRCVEYSGGQVVVDAPRRHKVFLPGSFNPLHQGHKDLLEIATQAAGLGFEGAFELAVGNADKGFLPIEEVRKRVAQFVQAGLPVVVTRATLFIEKAELFPNSRFVVGYDTAIRMVMPKYHGNSETSMLLDYTRMRFAGGKVIVAGRKDSATGRFLSLADVDVPPGLKDLFAIGLDEKQFRADISSTELRQRAQQQPAGAPR